MPGTIGFQNDYDPATEETPLSVIIPTCSYVALLLGFVIYLLTARREPQYFSENNDEFEEEKNADDKNPSKLAASQKSNSNNQPIIADLTPEDPTISNSGKNVSSHSTSKSAQNRRNSQKSSIAASHAMGQNTDATSLQFEKPNVTSAPSLASTSPLEKSALSAPSNPDQPPVPAQEFPRPLRSWDLMSNAAMRFRHGHFSGRSVQRLVQQERHAQEASQHEGSSHASQSRGSSWNSRGTGMSYGAGRGGRASEVANEMLESQAIEGEAEFYRQRYIERSAAQSQQQRQAQEAQNSVGSSFARRYLMSSKRTSGAPSVVSRTSSGRSRMPRLSPDVVSPDDAADAFDTGVSLSPERNENDQPTPQAGCCGNLLELAEPDQEARRILGLAAPSTLGAVAEPCFRLGMVAIISHFIDVDSMIAFVLVILFVRITTEELSGAITDAESSMLHQALSMGGDDGFLAAGQQMQLAVVMQLLTAIPILLGWALAMKPLVSWLIPENDHVSELASQYTQIIVVDYGLQAASRAFLLVFHLTGQGQFELYVDMCGTAVTIVCIALAASLADEPSLNDIALIQLAIGVSKIVAKIVFVTRRGLLQPYRVGFFGRLSLLDRQAVWSFMMTMLPLLMGSLVELREWEILVLFVRHLGGAEVAAWALMGILWEIFEASTEGLGEAAAVRVSLALSESNPEAAKVIAHKSILLCGISSIVITGVFLMTGTKLSVALTQDTTLQHLFNNLVGTTGLANIAMSLSQVYWSLLGSQGRFGVASSCILLCRWLLTMPLACLYIFKATFDLPSITSALAVGYMTSTTLLAWRLHKSDWTFYSNLALEDAMPEDLGLLDAEESEGEEEEEDDFDFDDESSDSTGFG